MRRFLAATFLLALSFLSFAQENDSVYMEPIGLNKAYLKHYWTDTKAVFSSPKNWEGKDWRKLSVLTAATVGLYFFVDQDLTDWSQEAKTEGSERVSKFFEVFGNGRYPVFTTAALYGLGAITKKEKPKRVSLLILESYLITGITAQVVKFVTSRERPWSNEPYNVWGGPTFTDPGASFFSGHSSTVWATAVVFAMEYESHKWVAPVAYSIATLSSLSRIHDNAHWATDVLVGSAAGYFMTRTIVKQYRKQKRLSLRPRGISQLAFQY